MGGVGFMAWSDSNSYFRLQTSDFRLQTSYFRLRTSDFRLPTPVADGQRLDPPHRRVRRRGERPRGVRDRFACDRRNPGWKRGEHIDARDGFEITKLVGNVRDAVVIEHEPRFELRFGFGELRVRDAVLPHAVQFLERR